MEAVAIPETEAQGTEGMGPYGMAKEKTMKAVN